MEMKDVMMMPLDLYVRKKTGNVKMVIVPGKRARVDERDFSGMDRPAMTCDDMNVAALICLLNCSRSVLLQYTCIELTIDLRKHNWHSEIYLHCQ